MNTVPSTFSAAFAPPRSAPCRDRRGSILIVAILILFTISSMVIIMCRSMGVEALAAANESASLQAASIERGGEQYAIAAIVDQGAAILQLDEAEFSGIQVGDGYFWIMRPHYSDDDNLPLYGLVDEGSKLNVNTPTSYESLMKLPNMTDDVAASIMTWRASDQSTASTSGADNEYYLSLTPPYTCKHGPFETLEELLLVKGFTHELLYGQPAAASTNSNSAAPGNSGNSSLNSLFGDEWTQRGLADLLTVYSASPRTAPDGTAKIAIGQPGQGNSRAGQLTTLMSGKGVSNYAGIIGALGQQPLRDIFDLLDAPASMPPDEFAKIADYITLNAPNPNAASASQFGRINVNTAPREVIACLLSSLGTAEVTAMISQRTSSGTTGSTSIGWVAQALKTKAVGLGLGNLITGATSRYSADILAVSGNGRAYKRCKIVIDTSGTTPKVIYRRDLTDRGWPLDKQVLASLRNGQGPGDWSAGMMTSSGGTLK